MNPTMTSKRLNCSLACSTQVVLEYETRCLNVKLLIFLALHYNTITPWKYNVGGANVFQKEMELEKETEKEEETRSTIKWRTTRDSPEQGITFSFAGVGGKCCSIGLLHRMFGLKIFGQDRQNRTWQLIRPLMKAV
jgi:hypothetical protein